VVVGVVDLLSDRAFCFLVCYVDGHRCVWYHMYVDCVWLEII
jgi:hypothetical protein